MIYLDVSPAMHGRAGLGRYSEKLAAEMSTQLPGQISLFYNGAADLPMPDSLRHLPSRHVSLGYKPWRMAVLLGNMARLGLNHLLPEIELFHSTEHLLMPLRNKPVVLTVHDLIYKLFPAYHKRLNYWYLNLAMPIYCRRATAIIAVSQATKRDIVRHYGVDPAKITVVYEAAAAHFRPPSAADLARVQMQYELPEQFLLHLSVIEPRKNLERLLEALRELRITFPRLQLLLAGARGWLYDAFFARIEQEGLGEVVRPLGWVPDQDLPAIIASASLAVQPSLYEGFGLPVLEHMACGQVVAASVTSSHPEVGGDAAAYFDPTNVPDMVRVISRLLTDKDEYHFRQELGLAQASRFSWAQTAQETAAVYERLLHDA